ncbi:MAG: arginine decarboxylase, pyruvoyl-dependent [Nitrospinota bacterium]|nr:arginine decarboxylase, pyruvoyl-dependent [Nitrospinota bacterium]
MSTNFVPKKMFFTNGVGTHKEELRSFELALRDAGIEKCNLVYVSSILPPKCKIISRKEGLKLLRPGEITFCVMARAGSNEPHRLVHSSIGCAVPSDKASYGYLSEHHGFGQTEQLAGDYAEDLAAAMLASTLGIEFDEDKAWDERKEVFRMSNKIVKTRNITKTAVVKRGYTTVLAVAVLLL